MRAAPEWLVAVSVLAALSAGCTSDDEPPRGDQTEQQGAEPTPSGDDCSGRIDEQITAGEIPNADRDYFIGMCQANP